MTIPEGFEALWALIEQAALPTAAPHDVNAMFAAVVGGAFGASPGLGANAAVAGLAPAPSQRPITPNGLPVLPSAPSFTFEQSMDALGVLAGAATSATAYFPPAVATLADMVAYNTANEAGFLAIQSLAQMAVTPHHSTQASVGNKDKDSQAQTLHPIIDRTS